MLVCNLSTDVGQRFSDDIFFESICGYFNQFCLSLLLTIWNEKFPAFIIISETSERNIVRLSEYSFINFHLIWHFLGLHISFEWIPSTSYKNFKSLAIYVGLLAISTCVFIYWEFLLKNTYIGLPKKYWAFSDNFEERSYNISIISNNLFFWCFWCCPLT